MMYPLPRSVWIEGDRRPETTFRRRFRMCTEIRFEETSAGSDHSVLAMRSAERTRPWFWMKSRRISVSVGVRRTL